MCGIAGYYRPQGQADSASLRAMCDIIRHRGPDEDGMHLDGGLAIGMRRLSIIDLSSGRQPIANEDDTVWIVFNGEIYNYQELRASLIAHGHRFRTNSDTEALIHLYEQEGTAGIARLRGMFGYAIWDSRDRSLLLVRDRFGKKPLYYSVQPDGITFGSELKSLLAAGVPLEPDPDAIRLYFLLSYVPEPHSIYRGIRKLPPGCWLRYDANGKITIGRYWDFPVTSATAPPGLTEQDAAHQLRDLFDEAVRIRLMADVPLGAFLSGGIDSSSVVASMSLATREPVKTFSIGFAEDAFNELPAARMAAGQFHTAHHEIEVRPDSIGLLESLSRYFDEPFGDSSAIPTFLVSEFAARHVKVALTGDGGDELFGGYTRFDLVDSLGRWDKLPAPLPALLGALGDALPYTAFGKNYIRMVTRGGTLARYLEGTLLPYSLQRQLLAAPWRLDPAEAAHGPLGDFFPPNGADVLSQVFYFETKANLVGDMLVKVDRMSMANSLEVRCPLLDHKLAEFAATLPHHWKRRDGKGKRILLDALGSRLPPALLQLPKRGFGVPLAQWFRTTARDFLRDHLTAAAWREAGFVSPRFLEHLMDEHQRGRRDNSHWLFRILMFALWLRDFRTAAPRQPLAASVWAGSSTRQFAP